MPRIKGGMTIRSRCRPGPPPAGLFLTDEELSELAGESVIGSRNFQVEKEWAGPGRYKLILKISVRRVPKII